MIDFSTKKGFICDMDGVIYHGNQVLPGVVEFIDWLHRENKEFLFLTNNSGYTPRELQQKLARMGLDVSEEHFYTSALATAAFLRDQAPGCSVYAIGEAGLLNALYDAGITMNDVNPDYVVIGEGKSYSLDTLTKATNLVLKGAKLIGANSDLTGPIENGIAPACRAPMIKEQTSYMFNEEYDLLHPSTKGQIRMARTLMYQLLMYPCVFEE